MYTVFMNGPNHYNWFDIDFKRFAGGEWNVTLPKEMTDFGYDGIDLIVVKAKIYDGDIMKLAILTDAIRRFAGNNITYRLELSYLPYARQDRVMNDGESLSLRVFCNFINSLKYDKVVLDDPHSDVSTALIDNVEVTKQWCWSGTSHRNYDAIVSPDAGALKKIYPQAKAVNLPVIEAMKTRDVQTGVVSDPRFNEDVMGKRLLIVDDICDGGRSFLNLGKVLKGAGAKRVDLYVTHGIFSYNAKENLSEFIDNVYCKYDWTV